MSEVRFTDNSQQILSAMEKAIKRGATAIGMAAEGHAKKKITVAKAVDTGRLRNSITYATIDRENQSYSYTDDNGKGYTEDIGGGCKPGEVYVGTNTEYAAGIETGSHRKAGGVHFLQDAATNHSAEYKAIMKSSMENA